MIGLATWSVIPAWRMASRSDGRALAVIATIGGGRVCRRRITACGVQTIHHRHLQVHEDKIVRSSRSHFNRLLAVCRFDDQTCESQQRFDHLVYCGGRLPQEALAGLPALARGG